MRLLPKRIRNQKSLTREDEVICKGPVLALDIVGPAQNLLVLLLACQLARGLRLEECTRATRRIAGQAQNCFHESRQKGFHDSATAMIAGPVQLFESEGRVMCKHREMGFHEIEGVETRAGPCHQQFLFFVRRRMHGDRKCRAGRPVEDW